MHILKTTQTHKPLLTLCETIAQGLLKEEIRKGFLLSQLSIELE